MRIILTTNALEGLFYMVLLRTDKVETFRNEHSCLLLVYAITQAVHFHKSPV